MTWKTENIKGKAVLKGDLLITATPKSYFQNEKKSNQEFRVILEWSKGSVTKDHKRDGVIGIYSSFKEGWSGDLDSSKLKLVAAKESSLDAHGESNAHLYYG